MTPETAKRILMASMLFSALTVTAGSVRDGKLPQPRRYIGLGATFLFVSLAVEFAPVVGGMLALLVATSVLLKNGESALDALLGAQNASRRFATARASVVPEIATSGGGGIGILPGEQSVIPSAPYTGQKGKIIGTPYHGTHTLGNWESDNAVDISLPIGTPLYACASGTIGDAFGPLNSNDPRMAGLRLHIIAPMYGGDRFYYAHLSRFAPGIGPGSRVRKGQLIGYSGSANGVPHLHFACAPPLTPLAFYRLTFK